MNDDDEFLPYEEDSDEEERTEVVDVEAGVEDEDLSDEAILRGRTDADSDSGWETGGETDAGFSDADAGFTSGADTDAEGEDELFPAGADPLAMLEGMEQNRNNDQGAQLQPYEVLARQKRVNRNRNLSEATAEAAAQPFGTAATENVFGASADEIWNEEVAEHLGMSTGKVKKRKNKRRHAEAITLLLAVIREAPNLPDAYHTLGLLYESQGDAKKALDFHMISAHLSKDSQVWKRIAKMSTDLGYLRQAIYCLKNALKAFKQLATVRPGDPEIAKMLARLHHQLGNPEEAKNVLQAHLHEYPTAVDLTHINILAELYMEASEWGLAVDNIQYADAQLCGQAGLPVELQVKAGVCCAHLESDVESSHGMHEAQQYFGNLLEEPLAENADLCLTVAEELLQLQHAEEALIFYKHVQELPDYNNTELWGKIARCQQALGKSQELVSMYEAVMQDELCPAWKQSEAALALAQLHLDAGATLAAQQVLSILKQPNEALDDTQQQDGSAGQQAQTLFHRAGLMLRLGQQDEFLELMLPMVSATIRGAEERGEGQADPAAALDPSVAKALRRRQRGVSRKKVFAEADTVFKGYTTRDRRSAHVRQADEAAEAVLAAGANGGITGAADMEGAADMGLAAGGASGLFKQDSEFQMLVQTGRLLLKQGRLTEAKSLIDSSIRLFAKRWVDKSRRDVLQMVLAEIHIAEQEHEVAYELLKPVCCRWPDSTHVWNTYCRVLAGMGGIRHTAKFILPLRAKNPSSLPLMLLAGHCLSQTTQSQALGEYFHAFRLNPHQPLTLLCIALGYMQQAMTRKVDDRNRVVLQAFAFFQEYARHREHEQESNYNLGRAAHHLGLVHIAVEYYQKCLDGIGSESVQALHGGSEPPYEAGLSQEAAFNLSLIYRGTGADDLARQVLQKYVSI
ncbi:MAG: hypothetical protein FRX49_06672 [Trebouxia sp. A1-2]|nr:MAG: hypothetical protein FRX49_06672 [Trebouxia sp. A1-2]